MEAKRRRQESFKTNENIEGNNQVGRNVFEIPINV
jgi:hypothetical protein